MRSYELLGGGEGGGTRQTRGSGAFVRHNLVESGTVFRTNIIYYLLCHYKG